MSSDNVPLDQSPPLVIAQPNYSPQPGSSYHASVAPVVAVLVAVAVLGVAAAIVGRLCTGKRIMGYGHKYDMESWAESKCSSCIDGRIHVSPPVAPRPVRDGASVPTTSPVQAQASRETEQSDRHSLHDAPSNASSCASL